MSAKDFESKVGWDNEPCRILDFARRRGIRKQKDRAYDWQDYFIHKTIAEYSHRLFFLKDFFMDYMAVIF